MWLWAIACWTPTVTTDTGVVGILHDEHGTPLAGVSVHSVEGRGVTDAEGRFQVDWKPPTTYVNFKDGSTLYQRSMLDQDRGKTLQIALPPTRSATLHCDDPEPCSVVLSWEIAPGFAARVVAKCSPGSSALLDRIPVGGASATCQRDATAPVRVVSVLDEGTALRIGGDGTPR